MYLLFSLLKKKGTSRGSMGWHQGCCRSTLTRLPGQKDAQLAPGWLGDGTMCQIFWLLLKDTGEDFNGVRG